jgi:hypothetical protein
MPISTYREFVAESKAMKTVDRDGLVSGWITHHGKHLAAPKSHERTASRKLKGALKRRPPSNYDSPFKGTEHAVHARGWTHVVYDKKDGGGIAQFDSRRIKLPRHEHVAMLRKKFGNKITIHDKATDEEL